MPKKFSHFVSYEPVKTTLFLAPVLIKAKLADGLNSDNLKRRTHAEDFFCELVWASLKEKYVNLRQIKQPQFDEFILLTPDETVQLLARRDKKTWRYQGATSQSRRPA